MRRVPFSLGLISAVLIGAQLVLMQLLSIAQWHHFAFMVISVALLGFGASGTAISLARPWFLHWFDLVVPGAMMACGAALPAATALVLSDAARFDSYLLLVDFTQFGSLVLTYFLLFVPFFLGALAIGLILVQFAKEAGRYYFANMLGSGLGALGVLALMWMVMPNRLPALLGLAAVAAGMAAIPLRYRNWLGPPALLALAICALFLFRPPGIERSPYKDLSKALDLPGANIEHRESSPYGLVEVVTAPSLRYAPGLSLTYTGEVAVRKAVFNNGNWFGAVSTWMTSDSTSILDYSTMALPYALGTNRRVATLASGTLSAAAHARARGAKEIDVVEPHSTVVSLLRNRLAGDVDSLLQQDDVRLHVVEPRAFLSRTSGRYDLITLPEIGSFGGSVGLFALQEQYTLTVESFREMWRRLDPGGAISLTVWMDYPYRNPVRAVSTLSAALRQEGAEPALHLAAVRGWGTMTLVAARSPIGPADVDSVRTFAERLSFDPVLLPGIRPDERMRFNLLQDTTFFRLIDAAVAGAPLDDYAFDVSPATDNRPYFSQFLKWASIPRLLDDFGPAGFPFLELGTLIAAATLVQISIAALILILLPLRVLGRGSRGKTWTVLYFAGIGIGFMFIEMILIQQFTLYFGHPIYAAAAVIGSVLIFSGIGSRLSEYLQLRRRALVLVTGTVSALILLYAFALMPVLRGTMGLPVAGKVLMALILIGIPATLMGAPFPMGLRHLNRHRPSHVPWAWAVNNCLSVMSAALAALLAVKSGFVFVMVVASASYAIVAFTSSLRV